ncbi:MAG: hypothetical protein ACK5O1_07235 [Holosporales bacterium]|jgi:hypothetical protein
MRLTDAQLYRLFVFGDWDLSIIDSEGRLQEIFDRSKIDPDLAAKIAEMTVRSRLRNVTIG